MSSVSSSAEPPLIRMPLRAGLIPVSSLKKSNPLPSGRFKSTVVDLHERRRPHHYHPLPSGRFKSTVVDLHERRRPHHYHPLSHHSLDPFGWHAHLPRRLLHYPVLTTRTTDPIVRGHVPSDRLIRLTCVDPGAVIQKSVTREIQPGHPTLSRGRRVTGPMTLHQPARGVAARARWECQGSAARRPER